MIWIGAGSAVMIVATVLSLAWLFVEGWRHVLVAAACSGAAVALVLVASRLIDKGVAS